jgi:hypothetical protein
VHLIVSLVDFVWLTLSLTSSEALWRTSPPFIFGDEAGNEAEVREFEHLIISWGGDENEGSSGRAGLWHRLQSRALDDIGVTLRCPSLECDVFWSSRALDVLSSIQKCKDFALAKMLCHSSVVLMCEHRM